jgi:hypothetical protein
MWDGTSIVRAPAGTRSGLLSRAALLAVNVDQGRPIIRGVFVHRKILCGILPPPSSAALPVGSTDPVTPSSSWTSRQLYEHKTQEASCLRCHSSINPLGFALANYDSLGRYQAQEKIFDAGGNFLGALPINSSATPPIDGPKVAQVNNAQDLGVAIGTSKSGPSCLVNQWYTYSMGRMGSNDDGCSKDSIYEALTGANGNVINMIKATAMSPTFKALKVKN